MNENSKNLQIEEYLIAIEEELLSIISNVVRRKLPPNLFDDGMNLVKIKKNKIIRARKIKKKHGKFQVIVFGPRIHQKISTYEETTKMDKFWIPIIETHEEITSSVRGPIFILVISPSKLSILSILEEIFCIADSIIYLITLTFKSLKKSETLEPIVTSLFLIVLFGIGLILLQNGIHQFHGFSIISIIKIIPILLLCMLIIILYQFWRANHSFNKFKKIQKLLDIILMGNKDL